MLAGGERVLVAVSGGADSVALLHVLVTLAPSLRLTLHVAHVDHRLRPDSARDAEFVTGLARRFDLPAEVLPVDVPRDGSPEAAARVARYAALEKCATRLGLDRIAVAHTADDQAETVLMRLLEGAGPRGLAGIPPVRGRIIRPLLDARRAAIVAELERAGLPWVEDPSNVDRRFLRNRIRHDLLPALACETGDIVAALDRTARLARETIEAIERMARLEIERCAVTERATAGAEGAAACTARAAAGAEGEALVLPVAALRRLPSPVAAEALRQVAARLGSRAPLRAWAYRGLARVIADPPPRRGFRLGGVTVEVSAGQVRLGRRFARGIVSRAVLVPGTTAIPEIDQALVAEVVDAAGYVVSRDPRCAAFDADALPADVRLRARCRGDRFTPFGGGERQLKHFFISAKVPRWRRDAVPLVEAGGEIIWVAGTRRGAVAPITSATRRIVELSLVPLADVPAGR